jgi:hypothetical protein
MAEREKRDIGRFSRGATLPDLMPRPAAAIEMTDTGH